MKKTFLKRFSIVLLIIVFFVMGVLLYNEWANRKTEQVEISRLKNALLEYTFWNHKLISEKNEVQEKLNSKTTNVQKMSLNCNGSSERSLKNNYSYSCPVGWVTEKPIDDDFLDKSYETEYPVARVRFLNGNDSDCSFNLNPGFGMEGLKNYITFKSKIIDSRIALYDEKIVTGEGDGLISPSGTMVSTSFLRNKNNYHFMCVTSGDKIEEAKSSLRELVGWFNFN